MDQLRPEQESEVRHLAQSGCDLFQGFYFSRPVEAARFGQSLAVPEGLLRSVARPVRRRRAA